MTITVMVGWGPKDPMREGVRKGVDDSFSVGC